jgi:hypothetical protein
MNLRQRDAGLHMRGAYRDKLGRHFGVLAKAMPPPVVLAMSQVEESTNRKADPERSKGECSFCNRRSM